MACQNLGDRYTVGKFLQKVPACIDAINRAKEPQLRAITISEIKQVTLRKLLLASALVSLPTEAVAQTCSEFPAARQQAIELVTQQTNAFRECLIAFPEWRAEAKKRYYDIYDVTETIPGKPRRVIVYSSGSTATAYVAPATRSRVEHSVEYEDIGKERRLAMLPPEERTALYADKAIMDAALSDEFMLCRGKVDATKLIPALKSLGWGWAGPLEGPVKNDTWYDVAPPLAPNAEQRCLARERETRVDAWEAEFNALPVRTKQAVNRYALLTGQGMGATYYVKAREAGRSQEDILTEALTPAEQPQQRKKPRVGISIGGIRL